LIPKSIARGHLHLTHPNLTDESLRAAVNQAPRHSSLEQRLLEYVNDLLYHAVSVSWFIDILRRYAVDTVCTTCIGLLWKWAGWFFLRDLPVCQQSVESVVFETCGCTHTHTLRHYCYIEAQLRDTRSRYESTLSHTLIYRGY
jgi:hypothetical protein